MSEKYEPEYLGEPQVTAFFACRDVLIERENLVSIFRIIDSANVRVLENSERAQFPEPVDLTVFIGFANFGIKEPRQYTLRLELIDPNGESVAGHTIQAELRPESPNVYRGVQSNVSGKLPGIYTYKLSVDGKLVTRTFFTVIRDGVQTVVRPRS